MAKVVYVDAHLVGMEYKGVLNMEKAFSDAGHEFKKVACKSKAEVLEHVKDAEAIITTYTPIDRDIMQQCPDLKVVVRNAIGYEILDLDAASEFGIAACNIPDYCTEEVATHTMALLLACQKKVKVSNTLVNSGEWKINYGYPIHRMSTQVLGLIGFGRIAKMVADYAKAFKMTVVAYDPFCSAEVCQEHGVTKVTLDELYAQSDAICVNAPLTQDNYHMIGKDSFAKMKDGVILVNTGRGGLVSTNDLVEALNSGKVKAAGLDVLEEEPLRDASAPILQFDNVIVTSHIAMDSVESLLDNLEKATNTVLHVFNGELPYNVLNKDALQAK